PRSRTRTPDSPPGGHRQTTGPTASAHPRPHRVIREEPREAEAIMPKMKTHKRAAKRFRKTGTGTPVPQQAHRRHIMEKRPSKRTRRLDGRTDVAEADVPRVKRLLGL